MLNLVKMMREETHGNGYTNSIKCPHAEKIPMSFNECELRVPHTRDRGNLTEDPAIGLSLDE
jgi:hypothetical protein